MFGEYLKNIEWLNQLGIATTVLFLVIFAAIIIWIIQLNKSYLNKMEKLPLE